MRHATGPGVSLENIKNMLEYLYAWPQGSNPEIFTNTVELLKVKSVDGEWVGDEVPSVCIRVHLGIHKMIDVVSKVLEHLKNVAEKIRSNINLTVTVL